MKYIKLNDLDYELIDEYKDAYNADEVALRVTDYFNDYDYIFGDWSYGKLRLKGFCDKDNKLLKPINDYSKLEDYIKNSCAYGCKYFVLKKVKEN